jgi:hypothetical protein
MAAVELEPGKIETLEIEAIDPDGHGKDMIHYLRRPPTGDNKAWCGCVLDPNTIRPGTPANDVDCVVCAQLDAEYERIHGRHP